MNALAPFNGNINPFIPLITLFPLVVCSQSDEQPAAAADASIVSTTLQVIKDSPITQSVFIDTLKFTSKKIGNILAHSFIYTIVGRFLFEPVIYKAIDFKDYVEEWHYKETEECTKVGMAKFNELLRRKFYLAERCANKCANQTNIACKTIGIDAFEKLLKLDAKAAAKFYKACSSHLTSQCKWTNIKSFESIVKKDPDIAADLASFCADKKDNGCKSLGLEALKLLAPHKNTMEVMNKCTTTDSEQCHEIIEGAASANINENALIQIKDICQEIQSPQCKKLLNPPPPPAQKKEVVKEETKQPEASSFWKWLGF